MSDADLWADNPRQDYKARIGRALADHFGIREEQLAAEQRKAQGVNAKGAKKFSTDYAIAWCKQRGYRYVEREHYVAMGPRKVHVDLAGGSDVYALDGAAPVYVQAAGKGQRAEHRRRFDERKWQLPPGARFYYLEFVRDSRTPILEEVWQ